METSVLSTLEVKIIALVTRDYKERSRKADFSAHFENILKYCDEKGCDSILFSPYTFFYGYRIKRDALNRLKNVKIIFIEKFRQIYNPIDQSKYFIFFRNGESWDKYETKQFLARIENPRSFKKNLLAEFRSEFKSTRLFLNFALLICGEINIVKYSKSLKTIEDSYSFIREIPNNIEIIINPIHDRMTRFEMGLKKKFLSSQNRIVVSVWNRGKKFKDGKSRDGNNPSWSIYKNGDEIIVPREDIPFDTGKSRIEIGILKISKY